MARLTHGFNRMVTTGMTIGRADSVSEDLLLLNPHQIPLLSMLGFSEPATNTEHTWYEDSLHDFDATLTAAADAEERKLAVSDPTVFRKGHVFLTENDEFIRVLDVDYIENEIVVNRGYADTVAHPLEVGAKLDIQYLEGEEGMDAVRAHHKPRNKASNVTQIFTDTVDISLSQLAVGTQSIDDFYGYEKDKVQTLLALQLEKAVLNGKYHIDGDVSSMRGIRNFIETNVTQRAGKLTPEKIEDALQAIYIAGGFANAGPSGYEIIVGADLKRAISNFDKSLVRIARDDSARGTVTNYLRNDFGEFPVSINDNLRSGEILIIDKNRIKIRPLQGREYSHEYLGKKGDYVKGMIVGEYTVEVQQEATHALIKGAIA